MAISLTKQQQQILVIAVMIIGGGGYGYWNYLLKPTLISIEQNEKKHKDLVAKIEKSRRQARRLPALQNQVEKLRTELAELEKQLPTDKNIPDIIRTLTREALIQELEFKSMIPPKSPIKKQYFEIIPFKLRLSGTLSSLARFLSSLGQQERIFKASNIKLNPLSTDPGIRGIPLSISLTIETYAYSG